MQDRLEGSFCHESICSALREKFGEKNPEMQVLH